MSTVGLQRLLIGKLFISSELVVETGLHIGGGEEKLDIGGLDKPVVRDPLTRHPYLPGSSIKGKLRSIVERLESKPMNRGGAGIYRYESDDLENGYTEIDANTQPIKFTGARTCPVSRVFGSTGVNCWIKTSIVETQRLEPVEPRRTREDLEGDEKFTLVRGRNSPAHLVVRDCHLVEASATRLEKIDTGLYMTEWKFENGLDRITAAANPRQVERVPKGAKFHFEMIYTVESESDDPQAKKQALTNAQTDLTNLLQALMILEDDALGGHGSRGYGKVKFENLKFRYKDYRKPEESDGSNLLVALPIRELPDLLKGTVELPARFNEIRGLLQGSDRQE